jgi:hypothetical protein
VIGVQNHIAILFHYIKNGEIVRGKCADSSGWLVLVFHILVLIPFLAMGQGRRPHMNEFQAYNKIGGVNAIRICLYFSRYNIQYVKVFSWEYCV